MAAEQRERKWPPAEPRVGGAARGASGAWWGWAARAGLQWESMCITKLSYREQRERGEPSVRCLRKDRSFQKAATNVVPLSPLQKSRFAPGALPGPGLGWTPHWRPTPTSGVCLMHSALIILWVHIYICNLSEVQYWWAQAVISLVIIVLIGL